MTAPKAPSSFEAIRAMTTKERQAFCAHNLTKGSLYGCRVGGVVYRKCQECPMSTTSTMYPPLRALWRSNMIRIGYFP